MNSKPNAGTKIRLLSQRMAVAVCKPGSAIPKAKQSKARQGTGREASPSQARLSHTSLRHSKPAYATPGQARPGQARSGQPKLLQASHARLSKHGALLRRYLAACFSSQRHPTEQTWRVFAPKSGGRWVVSLDTSFKTAAAFRHKMLPCFGLRPPRGNARHTLVCQRRPRPHSKTAAAFRHKMLPCFGLRPPRGNARHTLVCQSRPRPHTTRLCPRPRPMRKLSDLPLPTRYPSRQGFITAFLTPIRVSQNLRVATTSESARGVGPSVQT